MNKNLNDTLKAVGIVAVGFFISLMYYKEIMRMKKERLKE